MDTSCIVDIWNDEIAASYRSGRIATERTLQGEIYRRLCESGVGTVYLEPALAYIERGGPKYRPDLVIGNGESISLIGEIKFLPHWYPDYRKDLHKLAAIASEVESANLEITSSTGASCSPHRIDPETEYALLFVGKSDSACMDLGNVRRDAANLGIKGNLWIFIGQSDAPVRPHFFAQPL